MFLVILAVDPGAAIVAFIIYTLTMDKIREIAVLKLIGTRNRTIAAVVLQQARGTGRHRVRRPRGRRFAAQLQVRAADPDRLNSGFVAVLVICVLRQPVVAIRMALKVVRPWGLK